MSDQTHNPGDTPPVRKGNRSRLDIKAAAMAERQRKALELRKTGATYDAIAKAIGVCNKSHASKVVAAAIKAIIAEPAEAVRQLELERLDGLLRGHWKAAMDDPARARVVLAIMDRRARYLGLDAPERVQAVVLDVPTTPEQDVALAEFVLQAHGARQAPPSDPPDDTDELP